MQIGEYWTNLSDSRIQCKLCPHACVLGENQEGRCKARKNIGQSMVLPYYGWVSSIAIDPVEKKPLRMFYPGTQTFSVGFWFCTMDCPFCQNWEISHPNHVFRRYVTPEKLIKLALDSGTPSISFTYSEPTLHIEYVKLAMREAKRSGLKTILVTNGNLLERPASDILELTDAVNVDIKANSLSVYHEVLGGELNIVRKFIQLAFKKCHVEVTSLLVPGILDSPDQIESIATYIASVSKAIPLHITWYHPAFQWTKPSLLFEEYERIAAPAFSILDNVFTM
jgi:pyruvate formate lyase activating enzyme